MQRVRWIQIATRLGPLLELATLDCGRDKKINAMNCVLNDLCHSSRGHSLSRLRCTASRVQHQCVYQRGFWVVAIHCSLDGIIVDTFRDGALVDGPEFQPVQLSPKKLLSLQVLR
eukprot:COSAG03_NODE_4784_length_1435_cov_1.333084_2_plen_115_part_00